MKNDQEPVQGPSTQLQIEIDEPVARGAYANLALITHNETEFVLDFLFIQPQNPKAKVFSRVISSPIHAKRFLWALKDNIAKYEARFGAIQAGEPPADSSKTSPLYQ